MGFFYKFLVKNIDYRILVNLTRGLKFISQFQIRDFEG